MSDQQSSTFMFSAALDLHADLEKQHLSKDLRQAFQDHGISLSTNVTVALEESDLWRLNDIGTGQTYLAEKTGEALKVYSTPRTDVVLVVKGAGLHEAGDTLNLFVQGFWPAVKKLFSQTGDADATQLTIRQEHQVLQGYEPPPHVEKEHIHLAEISIGHPSPQNDEERIVSQRIWVKEAYWELGQKPPSRWKALFNEWHMATYALRRELTNWFRSLTLRSLVAFLVTIWKGVMDRVPSRFDGIRDHTQSAVEKMAERLLARRRDRARKLVEDLEFVFLYLSFWVIYSFLGTILLIALQKGKLAEIAVLEGEKGVLGAFFSPETLEILGLSLLLASVVSFFMSWRPSLQVRNRGPHQEERLPGLQRWILVPMIVTFIFNTWGYLLFFLLFLIPIVVTNIRRGLWWSYRKEANTDRKYETYSRYRERYNKELEKSDFLILMHLFPMMVVYRLMVVWILPVAFLGLFIAEILIATRILGDFGKTLEEFLNNRLGGFLGDVSAYAMDPSLALRVRSAVEYDIRFFHQMPQVSNIHIFAHSQGTPITFETIFTHMPKEYRRKIKTFVTIGSVLGYYYQIVPVLDEIYSPERFRKTDYELATFAQGFRWFNCWNLADNITGFYGLDEYDREQLKKDEGKRDEVRYPTNIRTRTRGHSDYWTNLDEVQVPFARRVLYDKVDEKWKPTTRVKGLIQKIGEPLTGLCLVVVGGAFLAVLYFLTRSLPPIGAYFGGAFSILVDALRKIEFVEAIIGSIETLLIAQPEKPTQLVRVLRVLRRTSTQIQLGMAIIVLFIGIQIAKAIALWRKARSIPQKGNES